MTMFVVVFYKDGQPVGVVSREGMGFTICMLSESLEKVISMGEAMKAILGYDWRVFEEIPA